jgi:hypothetical protein
MTSDFGGHVHKPRLRRIKGAEKILETNPNQDNHKLIDALHFRNP